MAFNRIQWKPCWHCCITRDYAGNWLGLDHKGWKVLGAVHARIPLALVLVLQLSFLCSITAFEEWKFFSIQETYSSNGEILTKCVSVSSSSEGTLPFQAWHQEWGSISVPRTSCSEERREAVPRWVSLPLNPPLAALGSLFGAPPPLQGILQILHYYVMEYYYGGILMGSIVQWQHRLSFRGKECLDFWD